MQLLMFQTTSGQVVFNIGSAYCGVCGHATLQPQQHTSTLLPVQLLM
jgi:hypothetical protein